jgi:hypothetical protein
VYVKEDPQSSQQLLNVLLLGHNTSAAVRNGENSRVTANVIELLQAFLSLILLFFIVCGRQNRLFLFVGAVMCPVEELTITAHPVPFKLRF